VSNKIKLLEHQIKFLEALPEQGMGYQIVDIELKDGKQLINRIIVNSEYLTLKENEFIDPLDIKLIRLHDERSCS
jgi:hypothetical protein